MANVAIISSYKYDHPNTDMNCAWSTVYTLFDVDTAQIITLDIVTGCGEKLPEEYNIVPINDAIRAAYHQKVEERQYAQMKHDYARFQKELDEYNAMLRPQRVGQRVNITEGKYKGRYGVITWMGKNKFNQGRYYNHSVKAEMVLKIANCRPYTIPGANHDLICIRPLDNAPWGDNKDKVYVKPEYCKVWECDYENVTVTEEDVYNYGRLFDDIHRKWNNGYDYYVA